MDAQAAACCFTEIGNSFFRGGLQSHKTPAHGSHCGLKQTRRVTLLFLASWCEVNAFRSRGIPPIRALRTEVKRDGVAARRRQTCPRVDGAAPLRAPANGRERAKPQNNPVPLEETATFANARAGAAGPDVDGGRRAGGPLHHDHDPSSARRNQRLRLEQTRSTAPSRSQVPCHSRFQAGLDRGTPRTDS
ncbi:hypothetical protein ROHU_031201 [Labeo rohita]|uniref:Uncharacterized protein n=1 Tax=Labeo rohita TaxID=84645 RepID=A0A498LP37_LABRO|nr:hypothetical protein ROHU_031201 [Labeo rohita]